MPAAGGLAYLAVTASSQPLARQYISLADLLALIATSLALMVAIGLWASAVVAMARHLKLTARVRAAELVLGSVISAAVSVLYSARSSGSRPLRPRLRFWSSAWPTWSC